jgi:AraC-like DNA-binding protein
MRHQSEQERLHRLEEENDSRSWADFGSCGPSHELLKPHIASYTYSVGCIKEQEAKFITRAYPTVMTQLYFEFTGGLSEVRDSQGGFAFGAQCENTNTTIQKRTYIKQGLGSWFDIYQLPSPRKHRPIKNLKIDLYPSAIYALFQLSPLELGTEDLELADLMGTTTCSLMLEEMEAAVSGGQLVRIAERYFVDHLLKTGLTQRISLLDGPKLPTLDDDLGQLASQYNKSKRWLQKHYLKVYGMSFKQMQHNLKFQRVHQVLSQAIKSQTPVNLTELAYRFDYFDQAHFIRDFKRYAGMTPGQYARATVKQGSQFLFYW